MVRAAGGSRGLRRAAALVLPAAKADAASHRRNAAKTWNCPGPTPTTSTLKPSTNSSSSTACPSAPSPRNSPPASTTSGSRSNASPNPLASQDWGRPAQARARFDRSFFDRECAQNGKRLRQLAAETGYSRKLLAECARQAGITLATARQTTPIDHARLREQYLKRKRSFPDIANGLDVSEMTVIRAAHRYGIPVRPAGVASHQTMIQTLDKSLPRDIRRAVEGSR